MNAQAYLGQTPLATQVGGTHSSSQTANRACTTDSSGNIVSSGATTDVQIGYLSTSTSDIQTQLNSKQATLTWIDSLQDIAGSVSLVGDVATPTANQYYGSGPSSTTRGFYNLPSATVTGSAQHLYVSQQGSDSNTCLLGSPCLTIQHTINTANAIPSAFSSPVVISVAPALVTPWTENLTFNQQGIYLQCEGYFNTKQACQLYGNITVNLTATPAGGGYSSGGFNNSVTITGFEIIPQDGSTPVTFSGTVAQGLFLHDDFISAATGTNSAISATNSQVSSVILGMDTDLRSSSSSVATVAITTGDIEMYGNGFNQIKNSSTGGSVSQAGGKFITMNMLYTGEMFQSSNTATALIQDSTITSGSAACSDTPATASTGTMEWERVKCSTSATTATTGSGKFIAGNANVCLSTGACVYSATRTSADVPGLPTGNIQPSGATISGLTASMPVLTDSLKNLVSGLINLATMVTGILPASNVGNMSTLDAGDAPYTVPSGSNSTFSGTTLTADRADTLPSCVSGNVGETHEFKNMAGQTHNMIPTGAGSDTIDGNPTLTVLPSNANTIRCLVAAKWGIIN